MNKMRYAGLLAIFVMMVVFASDGFGQKVGGYKEIESSDAAAQAAATYVNSALDIRRVAQSSTVILVLACVEHPGQSSRAKRALVRHSPADRRRRASRQ